MRPGALISDGQPVEAVLEYDDFLERGRYAMRPARERSAALRRPHDRDLGSNHAGVVPGGIHGRTDGFLGISGAPGRRRDGRIGNGGAEKNRGETCPEDARAQKKWVRHGTVVIIP